MGGVVYMPSPIRDEHGEADFDIAGWLFRYRLKNSRVCGASNVTVKLLPRSEPQPDCLLYIPAELGGQSTIDEDGYFRNAPELVVEVARSSRSFDLGRRKADYERAGVREYVVVELDPNRVHWFVLREGRYEELAAGEDGVTRSEVFPGLWLDAAALFGNDPARLIGVLEQGLATPRHADFVASLVERRGRSAAAN